MCAASVVMAGVAAGVERLLSELAPPALVLMQVAHVAAAIGAGVASLIAMAKVLRIAEFDEAQAVAWGWARKFLPD